MGGNKRGRGFKKVRLRVAVWLIGGTEIRSSRGEVAISCLVVVRAVSHVCRPPQVVVNAKVRWW